MALQHIGFVNPSAGLLSDNTRPTLEISPFLCFSSCINIDHQSFFSSVCSFGDNIKDLLGVRHKSYRYTLPIYYFKVMLNNKSTVKCSSQRINFSSHNRSNNTSRLTVRIGQHVASILRITNKHKVSQLRRVIIIRRKGSISIDTKMKRVSIEPFILQ